MQIVSHLKSQWASSVDRNTLVPMRAPNIRSGGLVIICNAVLPC